VMVFKLKGQITYFDSCKVPGTGIKLKPDGPIAQLDRVPDYESGGRGFESSSVRHLDQVSNAIFGSNLQITLSILTKALIVP
jgi:hypothetical protein